MPWLPELFTAPALQRLLDERRRESLVAVPYFDGLMAGDPDPLVESFVGEPEVHDPVRGRVKGEAAFRAFITEANAWLREHHASVDDVERIILDADGFEEVVLHLDSDDAAVDLPIAVVADRRAGRAHRRGAGLLRRPAADGPPRQPPTAAPARPGRAPGRTWLTRSCVPSRPVTSVRSSPPSSRTAMPPASAATRASIEGRIA